MFRVFSNLRFQLMAIVLLSVIPAIALVLYSGFEAKKAAVLQARNSAKRIVELVSSHQAHTINEVRRLLLLLSGILPPYLENTEECSAYLLDVLTRYPHFLNLGVIGTNGKVLCSALFFKEDRNFLHKNHFQTALEGDGLAIGISRFEAIDGKTSINFAYPLHNAQGHVNGVVFASADLTWLNELAGCLDFPEGTTLTVVDRKGMVLVRYPEPERWVGRVFPDTGILASALESGEKGAVETEGLDGVRRLYAFTHLGDSTLHAILYTGIPIRAVHAEANRALVRNIIVLGLLTILVLLVAYLFDDFVVMRRLNALIETSTRLAGGDMRARADVPPGSSEFERLQIAFNTMAESLEKKSCERDRMETALRRSEAMYRSLVEQIPVVIYTAALDEARTILYISPQIESLLGIEQDEFHEDRRMWHQRLHEEDRDRVLQELSRCRKENDLFICEYRMLTFNGCVKWIRDEAVTILNDAGEPAFIQGVMADITEQKRLETELVKANAELERRITERTEELASTNEKLRLSTQKLKFLAHSVVHDLKSPTIGIHGLTKLLRNQYGALLDERGIRYCSQIMKVSRHLVELVEKINLYMATKEIPLNIEPVNLKDIMDELREEFSSRLKTRSIKWSEPETEIGLKADRLSILRMLRNFIDNALKYGGNQLSEIKIEYQESEEFHILSVIDDGQGVSQADAENIFQMFQRSNNASGIEGSGLGLSIVMEIAEKHGGRVWLKSDLEKGVTFSCSIAKKV